MEMLHDEEQWKYDALADMVLTSDEAIVLGRPRGRRRARQQGRGRDRRRPPRGRCRATRSRTSVATSMHTFQKVAVAAVVDNNIEVTVRDAKLRHTNGTSQQPST